MQVTWLDILLAVVAVISSVVSVWGYTRRKDADARLIEVKQTANDAKERVQQIGDLTGAIKDLAVAVTQSSQQAATERDGWHKTITDTVENNRQFGITLGQVKEAVHTVGEGVGALGTSLAEGRKEAVQEVKTTVENNAKPIAERMDTLEKNVQEIKQMLTELLTLERGRQSTAAETPPVKADAPATEPPSTEPKQEESDS